jgi:hypothetical protein
MRKIDHKSFSPTGPAGTESLRKSWWLGDKKDRANAIANVVQQLIQYDSHRAKQYSTSVKLYGNIDMLGMSGFAYTKTSSSQNASRDKLTYNVVQSCIDTVTAKIGKNTPKAQFLTSGGDYRMQRRAKKLEKFIDGVFYENEAHRLGAKVFRDACIFGDGLIHVFEQAGRVKYERVLASELYVDWYESFWGQPRQLHRVKNVDKAVLADLFPDKAKLIMNANSATVDMTGAYRNIADQIVVIESWHLPSGPDAGDGLHCISITGVSGPDGGLLFEEPWTRDHFPFAKFPWCERPMTWWSQGLAEQIQPIQMEINKILWVIQRTIHLGGSFKVLLENGSKIVAEHLNNDIGALIHYVGTPPQYITPPLVQPELYQQVQNLVTRAYEMSGISMLSAASQKPQGLNSGKALREFNDIESDRFMTVGKAYENMFMDVTRLTVETAEEIYQQAKGEKRKGPFFAVKVPDKKYITRVDWSEVNLKEDDYFLKAYPVSSFSDTPSARLAEVQEFVQAGRFTPRDAWRLMDFPDLEQVETLQTAQEDYLHEIFEKIVEGDGTADSYTAPEPTDDLELAKTLVLQYIAQGKLNGLEEEKIQQLRDFNDQIEQLNQQAQAAMAPTPGAAPGGAPGVPQAQPMPAPQSNLLPQGG